MGDSGGRSRGNRTGEGARRRNTQRERALVDPPWDRPLPVGVKAATWLVVLILLGTLVGLMVWGFFSR
jgi:hypothetical protein